MKTWTLEQEQLLREKYPISTPKELAEIFPWKTITAINAKAKKMGVRKAKQKFHFTTIQLEELKRDFPTTLSADLAKRYGCSIHTIHGVQNRFRLKKDKEFIRQISKQNFTDNHPARKFWIKKGNVPVNKGKRQSEYMTAEAIERTKATRFKKGQIPATAAPVGFERLTKDGYILIKVPEHRKLVLKHRYVWEKTHGKIPKGCNIQFKDKNPLNCTIDNLYMISRSNQLKEENSFYALYPEDIRKLIHLKGALSRQINKIEKQDGINKQTQRDGK